MIAASAVLTLAAIVLLAVGIFTDSLPAMSAALAASAGASAFLIAAVRRRRGSGAMPVDVAGGEPRATPDAVPPVFPPMAPPFPGAPPFGPPDGGSR